MPDETKKEEQPKHKFANDKERLAYKREAFTALKGKNAEIAEVHKMLASHNEERDLMLGDILAKLGSGPFKMDGVLLKIRKVKGGGVVATEVDTNAEDVLA